MEYRYGCKTTATTKSLCGRHSYDDETSSEKRRGEMSYCIAIKNDSYIVLASDSRSIVEKQNSGMGNVDDSFEKITYLPKSRSTIMLAGKNRVVLDRQEYATPVFEYIKRMDNELAKLESAKAEALYITEKLQPLLTTGNCINLLVVRDGVGFASDITHDSCTTRELIEMWRAGYETSRINLIYQDRTPLIAEFTLSDIIRFVQHAITVEADYLYFTRQPSYIGGPIQICIIDRADCQSVPRIIKTKAMPYYEI